MTKMFIFLVFVFTIGTILSASLEGMTGLAATELTLPISETATTLPVASTAGFRPGPDVVWVDDEQIAYQSKTENSFIGLTRGYGGTKATAHAKGAKVYNSATNAINQLMGFNIAVSLSTVGVFRTILQSPRIFQALAKALTWDYSFLTGDLALVKYILLYPISAGVVIGLALSALVTAWGILRR